MSAPFLTLLPCTGSISQQGARADDSRFATNLCGAGGDTSVWEKGCSERMSLCHGAEKKQRVPQPSTISSCKTLHILQEKSH